MRAFLLFLCLYCSEPLDRREQSVVVGQQFVDREGRRCVVVWLGWEGYEDEGPQVCFQGIDGCGQKLYRWSEWWQMLEEVPQR